MGRVSWVSVFYSFIFSFFFFFIFTFTFIISTLYYIWVMIVILYSFFEKKKTNLNLKKGRCDDMFFCNCYCVIQLTPIDNSCFAPEPVKFDMMPFSSGSCEFD